VGVSQWLLQKRNGQKYIIAYLILIDIKNINHQEDYLFQSRNYKKKTVEYIFLEHLLCPLPKVSLFPPRLKRWHIVHSAQALFVVIKKLSKSILLNNLSHSNKLFAPSEVQ
jgi:hypothetical protein